MQLIQSISNDIAKARNKKIEEWIASCGITILDLHKYRLDIKNWVPIYEYTWYSIKWTSNVTYTLFPRRWRNAKKPISTITI